MESTKFAATLVLMAIGTVAQPAHAALTHSPMGTFDATGSSGQELGDPPLPEDPSAEILSMNGVSVSELQLGTTTFSPNPPVHGDQLPEYADNFSLSADASADGQDYLQTIFPSPTNLIFLIEKGGNDSGSMVGLDVNGDPVDAPVDFTSGDFNAGLGFSVYQGQEAAGMVIASDVLVHGIRFLANGIDPVSISSLPVPEPTALALAVAACMGISYARRRRR